MHKVSSLISILYAMRSFNWLMSAKKEETKLPTWQISWHVSDKGNLFSVFEVYWAQAHFLLWKGHYKDLNYQLPGVMFCFTLRLHEDKIGGFENLVCLENLIWMWQEKFLLAFLLQRKHTMGGEWWWTN